MSDVEISRRAPRVEEVAACPLCQSTRSRPAFSAPDRFHETPGEFSYRRCVACSTVFQSPRVVAEDLPLCYPTEYYTHSANEEAAPALPHIPSPEELQNTAGRARLRAGVMSAVRGHTLGGAWGTAGRVLARNRAMRERAYFNILLDELLPREGETQALDVGCGSGQLMQQLQVAGWQVQGTEWDERAARVAEARTGSTVHSGDLRDIELPLASFDLIVLSHVFEHLTEPLPTLERICELLRPGGRAVLMYPNIRSLGARIFGDCWFPLEVPRHMMLPPLRATARAARKAGLHPASARTLTGANTVHWLGHSRTYREGKTGPDSEPQIGAQDRLLTTVEKWLVRFHLPLGEEALIVLQRPV